MIKDGAPTVTPGPSRYTLTPTPDDPKNSKRKSPKVREKIPERKKQAAFATTSGVLPKQGDPLQAPTTKSNLIRADQQYQTEVFIIAGPSNANAAGQRLAAKQQAASRPKPSRAKETRRMNQAIAAGAPVIFTRDQAERERVIREIRHANEVLVEGSAPAKVGKAAKGKGKEIDGDKGKGKGKEKEVDRDERNGQKRHRNEHQGEDKAKQTTADQRKKKNPTMNVFCRWFRRSSK